ncbi:MAG: carboxylesterase [Alphaproteobacteria bacterium]|nr:carboxylesterase [Alphaproteobacteria bacterium]
MPGPDLGFTHVFMPGDFEKPVLLLLHGTGGNEHDLLELGAAVTPGAALLSVRGKVLENNMPRFFKRLATGVFDLDDLQKNTEALATFITAAKEYYNLNDRPLFALGLSNGANIAINILLRYPAALAGAILLRPMLGMEPGALPDLHGKPILILSGLMDAIVPRDHPVQLEKIFSAAKADIRLIIKPAGHNLIQSDLDDMQNWIAQH